jgi:hypothetical protein
MIDPELANRWMVTESLLEQAKQLLPTSILQGDLSVGNGSLSALADFKKYLRVNELGLALDELESLGEIHAKDCCGEYWLSLERAALSMELNERAAQFHLRFREFWRSKLDPQWAAIDEDIFARRTLLATKAIRDLAKCDLRDAIYLLHDRYAELRKTNPRGFSVSEDEYWDGCYS